MARFQDLSVDLLYVIVSHLHSDNSLLRDVALSCRLFRDVSQRFIVRDAIVSYSPKFSRSKLFLRTLEERPDLTAHVHRLELVLLREDVHLPEEANTVKRICRLLTNLREFMYSSTDYKIWHYELPFPLTWKSEHVHDQVRRIDWNHNMTIETLYKCMELPRIASIYCRELHAMGSTTSDIPGLPAGSSSVTELRIGSALGLPLEEFRLMLRSPRCLQKLTFEFHDKTSTGIEAARMSWLLEPVQTTLQDLKISSPFGSRGANAAHSLADFSAFAALHKLQIPLRYLIGIGTGEVPCPSTILPPWLRELTIAFVSNDSDQSFDDSKTSWNIRALTSWLKNLQMQLEQSKDLTQVILEETDSNFYHGDLNRDHAHDIIKDVSGTLDDSRIGTFTLSCRSRMVFRSLR